MEKCPLGQWHQILQANIAAVMAQSTVCLSNETCKDTKSACLSAMNMVSTDRQTLSEGPNLPGL
jgi:hypothetical protein